MNLKKNIVRKIGVNNENNTKTNKRDNSGRNTKNG